MNKSIGRRFVETKGAAVRSGLGREVHLPEVDVKTLLTTSTGWAPDTTRDPGFIPIAGRRPGLLDLVLATPTDSSPFTYMSETTNTSAAAETAEAGTYGESTIVFTPASSNVAKVTVWLPVTDEALEDTDSLAATIDDRLALQIRQRLEAQMLNGNGTAPNLRGILNVAGIGTQPKGADTAAVAIRKAKTKVQTPGYGQPDLLVINPTDAEEIDLAAAVDLTAPWVVRDEMWDVPRYATDALTAGTAVIGDWRNYAGLKVKKGLTLQVSDSHSTFFVEGKQAVRAEIRVAFPVYRPAAFVSVTGI
jgi:hypothetical protein